MHCAICKLLLCIETASVFEYVKNTVSKVKYNDFLKLINFRNDFLGEYKSLVEKILFIYYKRDSPYIDPIFKKFVFRDT